MGLPYEVRSRRVASLLLEHYPDVVSQPVRAPNLRQALDQQPRRATRLVAPFDVHDLWAIPVRAEKALQDLLCC